jgi:hypothetical protein
MKAFNTLVNAPSSLLLLFNRMVGALYHLYTKGVPVSYMVLPVSELDYLPQTSQVDIAIKVFSDIEGTPLYSSILTEVPFSKPNNIPTYTEMYKEDKLPHIPMYLDAPFEFIETRFVSRASHTVWILWLVNGEIDIVTPKPTQGRMLVGCDYITVNDTPDFMPYGVVRATKVIFGTELVNNVLRGCRWTHYSKDIHQQGV